MFGYIVFKWRGRYLSGVIQRVVKSGGALIFTIDNSEIVQLMGRINSARLVIIPSLFAYIVELDAADGTAWVITSEGNAYSMFYVFSKCRCTFEDESGTYRADNYMLEQCDVELRPASISPDRLMTIVAALRRLSSRLAAAVV